MIISVEKIKVIETDKGWKMTIMVRDREIKVEKWGCLGIL